MHQTPCVYITEYYLNKWKQELISQMVSKQGHLLCQHHDQLAHFWERLWMRSSSFFNESTLLKGHPTAENFLLQVVWTSWPCSVIISTRPSQKRTGHPSEPGSSLGFFLGSGFSREFFLANMLLHLHCLLFGVLCWGSVQHFVTLADVKRAS